MDNLSLVKSKYRPEIDGLRAFAVIAVIINHFNKDILPSGFLGVDIFFIISGFVITSSLANKNDKTFLKFIVRFYERRIKRLIPSLVCFVLITSILISFFVAYDDDLIFYLKNGLFSLFGISNILLFANSKDYFATSQLLNPFTHTWSLGVEEQFYFFFPFLIWFSGFGRKSQKGERNLLILILILTVSSFIVFIWLYQKLQPAAYFLMPSRFWEISSGCLLYLISNKNKNLFKRFIKIPDFLIFLLITGIMFFPLSYAVYSTILTIILSGFLIISLEKETFLYKLLTNNKVRHIGLISYSLYLWHWGILALSRWTIGIHWWSIPIQTLLIYFLSQTSYKFIENPLRKNNWAKSSFHTIIKGFLSVTITGLSVFFIDKGFSGKLYLGDINKNVFPIKYYSLDSDKEFCPPEEKFFKKGRTNQLYSAKCIKDDKNQTLFFIGDSHTMAFLSGAELIAKKINSNLFFINRGNSKEFDIDTYYLRGNDIKLNSFNEEIISKVKPGDLFIITIRLARFVQIEKENFYTRDMDPESKINFDKWLSSFEKYVKNLSKKDIRVIISSPIPEHGYGDIGQCEGQNIQWFNKLNRRNCFFPLNYFTSATGKYFYINQGLKDIASKNNNLYFFNAIETICPNSKCNFYLDGKLIYRDSNHITNYAANNMVAPALLKLLEDKKLINNYQKIK